MKFKTSNEPLSIFSYSSLTDIVMLLLIFFLLSSQFINQSGVKVKLPGSKMNPESVQSRLVVTITETGGIYAGNKQVGIDQLAAELSALKSATPDDNLVIMSDKAVTIEVLIKVIDAAKAAGIDKFTIQTEKEKQDK